MVVDHGAVPLLIHLLKSASDNIREFAMGALGNIICDGAWSRDLVLKGGALVSILECITTPTMSTVLARTTAETLFACCSGIPRPEFGLVCAQHP